MDRLTVKGFNPKAGSLLAQVHDSADKNGDELDFSEVPCIPQTYQICLSLFGWEILIGWRRKK